MNHREKVVEYIFNEYKKRVSQSKIANKLNLSQGQISLVTQNLDYLYGLDKTIDTVNYKTDSKDYSFSSDPTFKFLDSVEIEKSVKQNKKDLIATIFIICSVVVSFIFKNVDIPLWCKAFPYLCVSFLTIQAVIKSLPILNTQIGYSKLQITLICIGVVISATLLFFCSIVLNDEGEIYMIWLLDFFSCISLIFFLFNNI